MKNSKLSWVHTIGFQLLKQVMEESRGSEILVRGRADNSLPYLAARGPPTWTGSAKCQTGPFQGAYLVIVHLTGTRHVQAGWFESMAYPNFGLGWTVRHLNDAPDPSFP